MPVQKKLLARFPFFDPLSSADLDRVARMAERRSVPAHTVLFREGDPGDQFYMIISGKIEIVSGGADNEAQLNLLEAGSWFGELALIDNQPRSAAARAETASVLITLARSEFNWLVTTYPLALFILVSEIQQRLRERDKAYRAELELRAEQLERLHAISLDITRHRERDDALNAIRESAVDLLTSAGGDLYLYDAKQNLLIPQGQEFLSVRARRSGEGCTGRAFATRQACIGVANSRSPMFELAAPIMLRDRDAVERSLGVLTVYRASDGARYTEADRRLLELFASQAAIAIENAQLVKVQTDKAHLDGELSAAREVQRSLIPRTPPHIAEYQLAALWEPARQVSGDFYDFIPLPDGRWALEIADVSDKGTPAALFMASTRSVLRASANVGGSVTEIIGRANRTISSDSSGGMFVTVFFGILDPKRHVFSYVNAGHNNPLLLSAADHALQDLAGRNLALGILDDFSYTAGEIQLARGDVLLLYTDGVTEATNSKNGLYGDERLRAFMKALRDENARQIIRGMDASVHAFTGAEPQSDDITAMVLKRT